MLSVISKIWPYMKKPNQKKKPDILKGKTDRSQRFGKDMEPAEEYIDNGVEVELRGQVAKTRARVK